jgi:hypothetical protein
MFDLRLDVIVSGLAGASGYPAHCLGFPNAHGDPDYCKQRTHIRQPVNPRSRYNNNGRRVNRVLYLIYVLRGHTFIPIGEKLGLHQTKA